MSAFHVIVTDPARRAAFEKVFGSASVPVKSAVPITAELAGKGVVKAYQLDLEALDADAFARLVEHLAAKFETLPSVVETTLRTEGMAIMAEDCVVAIRTRLF